MRKSFMFGVAGIALAAAGCFALWSAQQQSIEPISLVDSAAVERVFEPLEGPRVVSLSAFDPDVMKTSYPPQYEGIPLLVGSVGSFTEQAINYEQLRIIRRVSVDFSGTESGSLIFSGYLKLENLPEWFSGFVQKQSAREGTPLYNLKIYELGHVFLKPIEAEIFEHEWLITEQHHYMAELRPCYPETEAKAAVRSGDQFYGLGPIFTLHIASVRFRGENNSSLNASTFFGVIEE